jgi:hypothetical protein
MFALSIQQPWAWCITHGTKRVENRTWRPSPRHVGQRFAIHAAKKLDEESRQDLMADGHTLPLLGHYELGAIVGVATLVRIATSAEALPEDQYAWWGGPVGLVLADVVPVDGIPCRGALGFWPLPADVEARLDVALAVPR